MQTFLMRLLVGTLCLGAAGFSQEIYEPLWHAISRQADQAEREQERVNAAAYSVCMFAKSRKCLDEFDELDTVFITVKKRLFRAAIIQDFFERMMQLHWADIERQEAMRRYEALQEKYKSVSSKAASTFFNHP